MSWIGTLDQDLFRALNGAPHPPWLQAVFWVVTGLGIGWVQGVLLLGGTLVAWHCRMPFRQDPAVRSILWPGLVTLVISGLGVAQGIKLFIDRPRPSNLLWAWVAPDERIFGNSFPSGHATTSFALAYVLWHASRGTRWRKWAWGTWVLAVLIAYSRVYRGVHYPFDALGGAVLGILTAWLVTRFLFARESVPTPCPQ